MRHVMFAALVSLVVGTATAAPVWAEEGDCNGDPGLTLDVPVSVAIGATATVCMEGPANALALFMVSLGEGPFPSRYGRICLDFPLVTSFLFQFDGNGDYCFDGEITDDSELIDLLFYAQYIIGVGTRGTSNQDSCLIIDHLASGDFLTYTQDSLGRGCEDGAGGCARDEWFDLVFPNGVTIGDPDGIDGDDFFALHFTSAAAVMAFLPATGKAGPLHKNETDPSSSKAGALAGQLLAARINLELDRYGAYNDVKRRIEHELGELIFASGVNPDIIDFQARAFIDVVDRAISGELGEGDIDIDGDGHPDSTLSDLSDALDSLNKNFDSGGINLGNMKYR